MVHVLRVFERLREMDFGIEFELILEEIDFIFFFKGDDDWSVFIGVVLVEGGFECTVGGYFILQSDFDKVSTIAHFVKI